MKIAIPTFGHRVSPRFDCAPVIVIVREIVRSALVGRETLPTAGWGHDARIKTLIDRGVDTVVCGGIDRISAQLLVDAGITVRSGVSGESAQAMKEFLDSDVSGRIARQNAEGT